MRSALALHERLRELAPKGYAAAMADARNRVRIAVGNHVSHGVANRIKPLDGLIVLGAHASMRIHVQAIDDYQNRAFYGRCIKRSRLHGRQAIGGLREILVNPFSAQLIVPSDGCLEVIGRAANGLSKLFEAIGAVQRLLVYGFLDVGLYGISEFHLRVLLSHLRLKVRIVNRITGAFWLLKRSENAPGARTLLIGVALAVLRILTSAIKILGEGRSLLSTAREAVPYTNIRHAIRGYRRMASKGCRMGDERPNHREAGNGRPEPGSWAGKPAKRLLPGFP